MYNNRIVGIETGDDGADKRFNFIGIPHEFRTDAHVVFKWSSSSIPIQFGNLYDVVQEQEEKKKSGISAVNRGNLLQEDSFLFRRRRVGATFYNRQGTNN